MIRIVYCLFLLLPVYINAAQESIVYNLPMYIGAEKNADFGVTLNYESIDKVIDVKLDSQPDYPWKVFLTGLVKSAEDKKVLELFINEGRKQKYTEKTLDLIYLGTSWVRDADSIFLKGFSEVGRFVFFILAVKDEIKIISIEKTDNGYQLPDFNESDFSYVIPSHVLINTYSGKLNKSIKQSDHPPICIIRNVNSSCNLFINDKVDIYNEINAAEDSDLNHFLIQAGKYITDGDGDISMFFSGDFPESNRQSFLSELITLKPLMSIEFSKVIVMYFGEHTSNGIKLEKLVRFNKVNAGFEIQKNSKFNFVDSTLSNSIFINSLVAQ